MSILFLLDCSFKETMIPRIIHYCWFGRGPLPELAQQCIESWHKHMPDYEYMLWNEENFEVNGSPYTREAYGSHKYAFVSDVARLVALAKHGGIYLDVDFFVYKPFDDLLHYTAFAGFEGSKHQPLMMGVIASEPGGEWITEQLRNYEGRHFLVDGKMDLTTNVRFISERMQENGFRPNGLEQEYKDLHIFPVEFFCPRLTTGEYRKTEITYCEHLGETSSWAKRSFKDGILHLFNPEFRTKVILLKRRLLG